MLVQSPLEKGLLSTNTDLDVGCTWQSIAGDSWPRVPVYLARCATCRF